MTSAMTFRPAALLGLLFAAILFAGPAAASALDKLDKGPKVGAAIPLPLAANDQNGKAQSFSSLTGERGLILLFTRSFDW